MQVFIKGKVEESISLFDKAAEGGYPKALLWQRGLSLYYADRFSDGADQFRKDVEMNPNDTEESIWAMLSEAQTLGFDEARKRMLKVGRDRRDVMRTVEALFRGNDEEKNLASLKASAAKDAGNNDQFYAALYLGLFAEAKGNTAEAKKYIDESVETKYARSSGDYMAALARVHQALRKQGPGAKKAEL